MSMDKATAEKMVGSFRGAVSALQICADLAFKRPKLFNNAERLEKDLIEALTTPKPQGDAEILEELRDLRDHLITLESSHRNDATRLAVRHLRMSISKIANAEATQAPPSKPAEILILDAGALFGSFQIAVLALDAIAESDLDNIKDFWRSVAHAKDALKAIAFARQAKAPPDRLLEASKAVLDWYNENGSVGMLDEVMAVLGEAIEAHGKGEP